MPQQVMEIELDKLYIGKANVRRDVSDLAELTASIREHGVLQPITVRPGDDGRFEVIIGRRRTAAARQAGLKAIPAIVKELTNGEAIVESLVENLQRGDLDVEDEGLAYERLIEVLGSQRRVAEKVGKSQTHIDRTLDALNVLRKLRPFGIEVSKSETSRFSTDEVRREGKTLPAFHAALLERAFRSPTVAKHLPDDEEEREQKYVELAQAIAPLPQREARKVLDRFKLYPGRPVQEVITEALAPVDMCARLAPSLARKLDELAEAKGKRAEDLIPQAVETFISIQGDETHKLAAFEPAQSQEALLEDPAFLKQAADKWARLKRERRQERLGQLQLITEVPLVSEEDLVHKVIIGDSKDVMRLMPATSVDLLVTSPPYLGLKEYHHDLGIDIQALDAYLADLRCILAQSFRVLKDGRFICVVVGQFTSSDRSYFIPAHVARLMEETGFRFRREHIWVKPLGVQGIWNRGTTSFLYEPWPRNTMINVHHEHILVYQKGEKATIFEGKNPLTEQEVKQYCWSVWELPPSEIKDHPAPFPLAIPERLIKMYSYEGEVVLDPFLGAGTTIQSAKALGRRGLGIEVSELYLPLIQQITGGTDVIRYDQGDRLDFAYLKE